MNWHVNDIILIKHFWFLRNHNLDNNKIQHYICWQSKILAYLIFWKIYYLIKRPNRGLGATCYVFPNPFDLYVWIRTIQVIKNAELFILNRLYDALYPFVWRCLVLWDNSITKCKIRNSILCWITCCRCYVYSPELERIIYGAKWSTKRFQKRICVTGRQ